MRVYLKYIRIETLAVVRLPRDSKSQDDRFEHRLNPRIRTLTRVSRIMIVGGPGSGKSTCAKALGNMLDLPVFHMDRDVYWEAGWVESSRDKRLARVAAIVGQSDWVFEGSFSSTYDQRLARAHMLIWLDTPLPLRLFRVIRRSWTYRGQVRSDLAEGCPERLDMLPGFLWFILRTAGKSRRKARALFQKAEIPRHRLTSASEVNAFFSAMQPQQTGFVAPEQKPALQ